MFLRMPDFSIVSPSQQVAAYLREQLIRGRWHPLMPGAPQLSGELGVDRKTIEAALQLLENDGLLSYQGPGRRRLVTLPKQLESAAMRIAILLCDPSDSQFNYIVAIHHALLEEGHFVFYAPRYLHEMKMDVKKVARMVKQTDADAWIILAGSHEVLQWFSAQSFPSFALFGRRRGLPIAAVGPDKVTSMIDATKTLLKLGHERIVLIARPRRRLPSPGGPELAFLHELEAHGITTSDYHLPPWDETIESYHHRLDTIFQSVPPTAMIIEEVTFYTATLQFLARKNIKVPEDVSMICTDSDPSFEWCQRKVAHIAWGIQPLVRRIKRWAENVSHGKIDIRQSFTNARFIPGDTIGPARKQMDLGLSHAITNLTP